MTALQNTRVLEMNKIFTIVVLVLIINGQCKGKRTPPVATKRGLVVGTYLSTVINSVTYAAYKGIPYAEPPIGKLRFKPPVKKKQWDGELPTISDKRRCMQLEEGNVVGSEDCLYLNVYTPIISSPNHLKPVMVWIHGGAFTTGSGNSTYFGPDFLIEEDVLVVSIQYRLGPLGFLNIHHPYASGNMGLKDQNLALYWVQENIENFVGNPKQVTLFGQSAGGVSVDLHKLSQMSTGLFNKTISMSASPLCLFWAFQTKSEALLKAFMLGAELGFVTEDKEDLLNLLMKTPASKIIQAAGRLGYIPFRPTLESISINKNKFLDECSPTKYIEGRFNRGPHLMGFTSAEILEFAQSADQLVNFTVIATNNINQHLSSESFIQNLFFQPLSKLFQLVPESTKGALDVLIQDLSDIFFITGIDYKQQLLSNFIEDPVYYYYFSFQSSYSAHKSQGIQYLDGVAHEDELPYIFYRPFLKLPLHENDTANMRKSLVKMWTNFAKYGNPTPNNSHHVLSNVNWLPSGESGSHLDIGKILKFKEKRPTNWKIKYYQFVGLGDSKVLNDC